MVLEDLKTTREDMRGFKPIIHGTQITTLEE